jgi:serine O-acetyltransferase
MSAGVGGIEGLNAQPRREAWFKLLYLDYRRYRMEGHSFFSTLLAQGFWATAVYRMSHALVAVLPPGPLRLPAKALGAALQKIMEILTGICIPRNVEIGAGVYFPRFGGIILSHAPIGENCTLEHSITLGIAGKGDERGHPTIGNRVYIGAHSIVVGKITIGDDAVIFPGSVVTRSVPPRAVVMGYPAKIVSHQGSFDRIAYDGMDYDPGRKASLDRVTAA